MYDVLDVCEYIIFYYNEKKYYNLSNLRLQSMLFFVQVAFIYNYNEVCFNDNIEAWGIGAVTPKAYNKYKDEVFHIYEKSTDLEGFKVDKINESHKEVINNTIDSLIKFHVSVLIDKIKEQIPWKKAFRYYQDRIIRIEDIKKQAPYKKAFKYCQDKIIKIEDIKEYLKAERG